MIIEKIQIVNGDLAGGKAVEDIDRVSIPKTDAQAGLKYYTPVWIKCTNNSDVTGNFTAMSDSEYATYLITPTITDMVALDASGGVFSYVPTMDKVTKVIITSAAFTGTYDIEIWKE